MTLFVYENFRSRDFHQQGITARFNSDGTCQNPFLAICTKLLGLAVGDKRDLGTAIVAHPHPNLRPAFQHLTFFV